MASADINAPKDDLEKIKNTDVVNVWSIFVSSIKNNYKFSIVLPALSLILCAEISFLFGFPHPFFYCAALLFVAYAVYWQKTVANFLKEFAKDIGYSYEDMDLISSVEGHLFTLGHSQDLSKIIKGKYFDQDSRLFVFTTTIGSGKNKHTERYSVLEISFDTLLPNILLRNKTGLLSFFGASYIPLDNERELKLEGDFNKYFSLYVSKEYEIEAMQVFTPDIMQMFIDRAKDLSVEMLKSKVYLYYQKEITTKEQLVHIYSLAKDIILELEPTFLRMKAGVEDMSKYAKLT